MKWQIGLKKQREGGQRSTPGLATVGGHYLSLDLNQNYSYRRGFTMGLWPWGGGSHGHISLCKAGREPVGKYHWADLLISCCRSKKGQKIGKFMLMPRLTNQSFKVQTRARRSKSKFTILAYSSLRPKDVLSVVLIILVKRVTHQQSLVTQPLYHYLASPDLCHSLLFLPPLPQIILHSKLASCT